MTELDSFRSEFFSLLEKAQSIVITSHISPDDDSIGSVLAAYAVLIERYPAKDINIIYTGEKVSRYGVFHNFEKIQWVDDVGNHVGDVDVLIMLDASQYARFSKLPERLSSVPVTIAIDHHASAPDTFSLLLLKSEYSSNAELLYRTLIAGGAVSKEIAECVLLGIVGDTGSFSHVKPTQADVFVLAKELIQTIGVSIDEFRARYGGIPFRIFPLLQLLVKNTRFVEMEGWPAFQYTSVDRELFETERYTDEDMSAASHIYLGQYLPRMQGYTWGFVVTPRSDGGCRMSSRSLPKSVNVRDFHEKIGVGSGHDRASGGYFAESEPSQCIAKVLDWMHNNRPLIG